MLLKVSQNSLEKNLCRSLFFSNVAGRKLATPVQVFSFELEKKFKNTYFVFIKPIRWGHFRHSKISFVLPRGNAETRSLFLYFWVWDHISIIAFARAKIEYKITHKGFIIKMKRRDKCSINLKVLQSIDICLQNYSDLKNFKLVWVFQMYYFFQISDFLWLSHCVRYCKVKRKISSRCKISIWLESLQKPIDFHWFKNVLLELSSL